MSRYSSFDSAMLKDARAEAARLGVTLPLRMVALKVGRQQYAVQADFPYNRDHYVRAQSASEAKARWIEEFIAQAVERRAAERTAIGNTPTCEDCGAPEDHCVCANEVAE